MTVPNWLARASSETMKKYPFPLKDILRDSLYYPACGFHHAPVTYLSGCLFSFVYVDNGEIGNISREALERCLQTRPFKGYVQIGNRSVHQGELWSRWARANPIAQQFREQLGVRPPPLVRNNWFCEWLVFQRQSQFGDGHGAPRFSLLYICAEGAQAFQRLYTAHSLTPKAVAVIQTGWPELFERPSGIFAQCVLGNPAGRPEMMLFEDLGEHDRDRSWLWPGYRLPCVHEWNCIQRKTCVRPHDHCRDYCGDQDSYLNYIEGNRTRIRICFRKSDSISETSN